RKFLASVRAAAWSCHPGPDNKCRQSLALQAHRPLPVAVVVVAESWNKESGGMASGVQWLQQQVPIALRNNVTAVERVGKIDYPSSAQMFNGREPAMFIPDGFKFATIDDGIEPFLQRVIDIISIRVCGDPNQTVPGVTQ